MSIQAGATGLEKANGGRSVLLGGVPGALRAKVVVIGGGVVGFYAAQMAVGYQVHDLFRNLLTNVIGKLRFERFDCSQ